MEVFTSVFAMHDSGREALGQNSAAPGTINRVWFWEELVRVLAVINFTPRYMPRPSQWTPPELWRWKWKWSCRLLLQTALHGIEP